MTTQTYGMQLRERIVAAREEGHSAQEVAQWFKVSKRSVERYWKSYLETGAMAPKQRGGYRRSRLEPHTDTLRQWIAQQPDLTLKQLQQRCLDILDIHIGTTALWQQLKKLGLTFKKKTLHASEQDREDVRQARQAWRARQPDWPAEKLIFLDETGLNTKMTRRYGRAPKTDRCICKVPHGHWHTTTFIAALKADGLHAPWLLDGPMNGASFLVYVKQILGPQLRQGDLVICDNLSSHHARGVRQAIEAAGASLLYLPAYSPDLNPIEMAFSKLKAFVRKRSAREFDDLVDAIAELLPSFTPTECKNLFRHAKYATK